MTVSVESWSTGCLHLIRVDRFYQILVNPLPSSHPSRPFLSKVGRLASLISSGLTVFIKSWSTRSLVLIRVDRFYRKLVDPLPPSYPGRPFLSKVGRPAVSISSGLTIFIKFWSARFSVYIRADRIRIGHPSMPFPFLMHVKRLFTLVVLENKNEQSFLYLSLSFNTQYFLFGMNQIRDLLTIWGLQSYFSRLFSNSSI